MPESAATTRALRHGKSPRLAVNRYPGAQGAEGARSAPAAAPSTKSESKAASSAYASRHQAAEQRRRTRINERCGETLARPARVSTGLLQPPRSVLAPDHRASFCQHPFCGRSAEIVACASVQSRLTPCRCAHVAWSLTPRLCNHRLAMHVDPCGHMLQPIVIVHVNTGSSRDRLLARVNRAALRCLPPVFLCICLLPLLDVACTVPLCSHPDRKGVCTSVFVQYCESEAAGAPCRLDRLRQLVPHAERANTASFLEEVIHYIEELQAILGLSPQQRPPAGMAPPPQQKQPDYSQLFGGDLAAAAAAGGGVTPAAYAALLQQQQAQQAQQMGRMTAEQASAMMSGFNGGGGAPGVHGILDGMLGNGHQHNGDGGGTGINLNAEVCRALKCTGATAHLAFRPQLSQCYACACTQGSCTCLRP